MSVPRRRRRLPPNISSAISAFETQKEFCGIFVTSYLLVVSLCPVKETPETPPAGLFADMDWGTDLWVSLTADTEEVLREKSFLYVHININIP